MDPELLSAVNRGDVKALRELFESSDHDIFLAQENQQSLTMLHILSSHGKEACVDETLKRLPIGVVRKLICQTNAYGNNPLHDTATYGFPNIAKLLVDAYRSSGDGEDLSDPPWRAKNNQGILPVQEALRRRQDEVAAFFISVDPNFLHNVDDAGSLLRDSVKFKCNRTAKVILASGEEYSTKGFDLDCIIELIENCSESDAILLLQQHPKLARVQNRYGRSTILHYAADRDLIDITKTVVNIDISICHALLNQDGRNPLHIAARFGQFEIAQIPADEFNKSLKHLDGGKKLAAQGSTSSPLTIEDDVPAPTSISSFQPLWRKTDGTGITPLHLAVILEHKEIARLMFSSDFAFLSYLADSDQNPQTSLVTEQEWIKILEPCCRRSFMYLFLESFLQFLSEKSEKEAIKLIKQHPELLKVKDAFGRTILQYALDENDARVISIILKIHPSAIDIRDGEQDEHLLIEACRKGNLSAVHVICDICPQAFPRGQDQTTALHNAKLKSREEYRELLAIPVIAQLKNTTDGKGRSPLIKAIQDNNFYLAEALLEMEGVDVMNIKGQDDKTAAALLKDKSKESADWENLYKEATQKTSYVPLGTDLKDMRNTLSVVAALLATITFAAAFTVPGGFDQNNGAVLLGRKPAFIIFILSDTYAMCCSMTVLYALIWATVQEPDKASVLIDYSVVLLHHSLYGTLGAFMTGLYTMLSPVSIWVAIVVLVMCSTVVISAYMIIRFKLVDKFIGTNNLKRKMHKKDTKLSEILLS